MKNFIKNPTGFTLVELLVVIAIIGILSGIVTVSVITIPKKARDAQRYSDIKTISDAVEAYVADNGHAPDFQGTCGYNQPNLGCSALEFGNSNWAKLNTDLQSYIKGGVLPKDPCGVKCFDGTNYFYYEYVAPGAYAAYCSAHSAFCGVEYTQVKAKDLYHIYAENLEMSDVENWGFGNTLGSF